MCEQLDAVECLESVVAVNELDQLHIKLGILEIKLLRNKIKRLELLLKEVAFTLEEVRDLSVYEATLDHINDELTE